MTLVERERRGACAVLTFGAGAVNALSGALAQALRIEIEAACDDRHVEAIVLIGRGKHFSAGADIAEFERDADMVSELRALMRSVDAASKPVVAAISGVALGGGLELAVACHARVAAPAARLGFPEITLGLLPGAGGTQRLPRLVSGAESVDLLFSGRPIGAQAALQMGLVEKLATDDLLDAACERALAMRANALAPVSQRACANDLGAALETARIRGLAQTYIADCLRAASTLGFAEGEALEHRLFDELLRSEPSIALRHVFIGERTVARLPHISPETTPSTIRRCAVIGAGTMGAGIATALLANGFPTVLIDARAEALNAGVTRIQDAFARDVEKGRLSASARDERLANLKIATDFAAAADSDLVIEAVFEDIDVKRQVFTQLDAVTAPHAILASNTSTLDVDAIAAFTNRPAQVVGLHFFSPAHIMRLIEIVRGNETSPQVLVTALEFARRLRKVGVVASVCDGFIGNRMFEEYLRQAYFLLEEGALPAQIDTALEKWGMAMGPFKVMDLAGQDIGWAIRKRRAIEQPKRPYSPIPDRVCALGRYGQKTGAGFYLYPDGRTAVADPSIDAIAVARSAEMGLARRQITDDEIVKRCVYALVNEGAQILEDGVAYRPVDIDIIWTAGYGFASTRGGPMHYADRVGLNAVQQDMQLFATGPNGWAWEATPLLKKLAKEDLTFGVLNV
jgi:3-hydroxyacyl-CoA dehydrogenase